MKRALKKKTYKEYAEAKMTPSPCFKNTVFAFLGGGSICLFGQILRTLFQNIGLDEKAAGTAVSCSLIFLGVALTALRLFEKIAKFAGAGTLVPITGFANAMVSPALEFKREGLITGTAVKLFTIAGPVLVYGTSASVVYGLILCLL